MECLRRVDPVIYIRSSKDFKMTETKKYMERNKLCTGSRYCSTISIKYP